MDDNLVINQLRLYCKHAGSQKAVAATLHISRAYLSHLLSGRRRMTETVAAQLGYVAMWVYAPAEANTVVANKKWEASHERN